MIKSSKSQSSRNSSLQHFDLADTLLSLFAHLLLKVKLQGQSFALLLGQGGSSFEGFNLQSALFGLGKSQLSDLLVLQWKLGLHAPKLLVKKSHFLLGFLRLDSEHLGLNWLLAVSGVGLVEMQRAREDWELLLGIPEPLLQLLEPAVLFNTSLFLPWQHLLTLL